MKTKGDRLLTIHELKIKSCFYENIRKGRKTSELRKNDRDFQVGDLCQFEAINKHYGVKPDDYSEPYYQITHVLDSGVCDGLEKGYCILSLKPVGDE